jgi:hypothetical protein
MSDDIIDLTPEQRQDQYDQRLSAVACVIASQPEPVQKLLLKWRRVVERCGRLGPTGNALAFVEEWVQDVVDATDAMWAIYRETPGNPLGGYHRSSGA